MSFSSDIKEEILKKIDKVFKPCCIEAESFGELLPVIENKKEIDTIYNKYLSIASLNECCIKNILKGTFLSSGYITDPNSDYRLEIIFKSVILVKYFNNLLNVLDMTPKITKRKTGKTFVYVVYILESNQISKFLSLIEATKSLLEFENIRVTKEVNNNINRQENIKNANMTKTIKSAIVQIEKMNKIKETNKLNLLNDKLIEVLELRINNPYDSLEQLSKKLNMSKSGLKHRIDKIMGIID